MIKAGSKSATASSFDKKTLSQPSIDGRSHQGLKPDTCKSTHLTTCVSGRMAMGLDMKKNMKIKASLCSFQSGVSPRPESTDKR